jgi:hypothetical protein
VQNGKDNAKELAFSAISLFCWRTNTLCNDGGMITVATERPLPREGEHLRNQNLLVVQEEPRSKTMEAEDKKGWVRRAPEAPVTRRTEFR